MAVPGHIAVEGPIGVGKTSLVRLLAERFEARAIFEEADDNPFLDGFYRNPRKYAFQTQLFFLLNRFQQQRDLKQQDLFAQKTICDYLFAKDRIFAYLNLDEDEIQLYEQIYRVLDPTIVKPDLVIYLTASPHVLMRRIRKRSRKLERNITQEYLDSLTQAYSRFFFSYDESRLLVVNSTDIDFVVNQNDFEGLVREIETMGKGVRHYIPLGSD